MTIRIESIKTASEDEWNNFWECCDFSTYFQSYEWAKIWSEYSHDKIVPCAVIIYFSDQKSVLLPLTFRKALFGFFRQHYLAPAGTFGGWLTSDSLDVLHISLLHSFIKEKCPIVSWRLNPYDSKSYLGDVSNWKEDTTHAIDLSPGFEEIKKQWSKGHRRNWNKAMKQGMVVHTSNTIEDWENYFSIYLDSLNRWGERVSSRYSWKLFELLYKVNSKNIKLWLATLDGKVISGALCFYSKKHVVYWHGATLEKYFKLRPSNLVMGKAIEHSSNEGYKWFDFNPSGGHEGVRKFKEGFSPQVLSCPVFSQSTRYFNFSERVRKKLES